MPILAVNFQIPEAHLGTFGPAISLMAMRTAFARLWFGPVAVEMNANTRNTPLGCTVGRYTCAVASRYHYASGSLSLVTRYSSCTTAVTLLQVGGTLSLPNPSLMGTTRTGEKEGISCFRRGSFLVLTYDRVWEPRGLCSWEKLISMASWQTCHFQRLAFLLGLLALCDIRKIDISSVWCSA